MYERNPPKNAAKSIHVIQENLNDDQDARPNPADLETPGLLFKKLVGSERCDRVESTLASMEDEGRVPIDLWAQAYNVCFEPVSELATISEAYCSVFWDPNSTWIIIAFR